MAFESTVIENGSLHDMSQCDKPALQTNIIGSIRKFFRELNILRNIESMWRLFPELKVIQVIEFMGLGR
jgi:hypothetical protein